ncbi:MAG: hypothetical protein JW731_11540 [Bacteroidales bacterium]|nr:hypothetical protein [Bacteroidales bacterium]
MTQNNNFNDDFIRKLVQKSDTEQPSKSFTNNVMDNIIALEQEKAEYRFSIKGISYWYFAGAAGIFGLLYTIYFFLTNEKTFITQKFDPAIIPGFESIFQSFEAIFESFKISSFTIIIIAAIVLLFAVDQILRRTHAGKYFTFTF